MKNLIQHLTLSPTLCLLMSIGIFCLASCKENSPPTESPLSTFEVADGFRIELLVSEPLISDPVDMEIDEYGRLYVVEMHGYPLDKSGSGKIKILTDSDSDGRFDKSTIFADGLILPNSIMRWKKGVIVTDAPNVLYFEDSDGDGKAEIRDTLLTGFALSNPQHNLNSPVLSIDNWIYLAHEGAVGTETYLDEFGDRGSEIYFPDQPKSPRLAINAGGRSVRFNPDGHMLEMTSSHSQFGHTFDSWGHHLQVGNANHIFQEVIAERYLKRNPELVISDATESLSDHGDAAEVFPITLNPQHQLLTDVGVITSACGLTAYSGGAFPPPYDSVTFVAEPVSNLIHVDRIKPKGTTFSATRILEHKEFLASTDPKFRPVNIYVGPDGALYIIDYYRQIIEHPEWMGEEVVKSGELYNDTDKGRIYRITPESFGAADWIKGLALGDATNEQLVEMLSNSNSWWRMNAQRLLIDRGSVDAVPSLIRMTANPSSAMGRLHALWTLKGLKKLQYDQLEKALQDPVPGIRENAILLAEGHLKDMPDIGKLLYALAGDADPKVRFQLLCTLGELNTKEAIAVRHQLLFNDIHNEWVQVAALSATSTQTSAMLKTALENFRDDDPAYSSLIKRLTTMIGAKGDPKLLHELIQMASDVKANTLNTWHASVLDGLAQGMRDNKSKTIIEKTDQEILIKIFFTHLSSALRKAALHVLKATSPGNSPAIKDAIRKAASVARDSSQTDDKRADVIDFLSIQDPAIHFALLKELFVPEQQLSIQLAALRTLSAIPDTTVCSYLLNQWSVFTPEIREAAVRTFLVNDDRVNILLRAINAGTIKSSDLSWPQKVRLMAQSNIKLRDRARVLLTKNNDNDVNASYQKALELKGDAISGENIYQAQCALCHQLRGKAGVSLGPDLGTIHNWSKESIMANVLAPNQSISSGYDLWAVELRNGESIQGIISSETPGAITLKNSGTAERTIRRQDIITLKALGISVMPAGLEKQISLQQMADLLEFLKENK